MKDIYHIDTMIADMLARYAGGFGERKPTRVPDVEQPKYGTTD